MTEVEIIQDDSGEVLAVAHTDGPLSAQGRVALTEVAELARARMQAEDPDGFQGDIQRRALDRLHRRDTPECGHVGGRDLHCTRPAGHQPANIHAVAAGGQRWES